MCSCLTPAKPQPTHYSFTSSRGLDPLSKPRGGGGSIRPGDGIKVAMNVTTWSSRPSSLVLTESRRGSHWTCYISSLIFSSQQPLLTSTWLPGLTLAGRGCSEVSPSTSLVVLKVNASARRSILNFSCFLKEPCAFHACRTCNSGELIS